MVEVRKLCKVYGTGSLAEPVLHDVNLSVQAGEVLMLVGPSGSGKTTLLSILGCLLAPTSGSVRLAGHEVAGMPETALPTMRLRFVGFVFQSHNLLLPLTAVENVKVPLLLRGRTDKQATAEATELLARVGLGDTLKRYPADLSGGQKQRVAIARALAGRPPLLLADEPTASLDAESGRHVMETLASLAHEGGHTVVVVTHDDRIFEFGDRIARIVDGRLGEELHARS
jgi:putative ABC transport system ATP-binding protein